MTIEHSNDNNDLDFIDKNDKESPTSEISSMTGIAESIAPIGLVALLTLVIYLAQKDNKSNENKSGKDMDPYIKGTKGEYNYIKAANSELGMMIKEHDTSKEQIKAQAITNEELIEKALEITDKIKNKKTQLESVEKDQQDAIKEYEDLMADKLLLKASVEIFYEFESDPHVNSYLEKNYKYRNNNVPSTKILNDPDYLDMCNLRKIIEEKESFITIAKNKTSAFSAQSIIDDGAVGCALKQIQKLYNIITQDQEIKNITIESKSYDSEVEKLDDRILNLEKDIKVKADEDSHKVTKEQYISKLEEEMSQLNEEIEKTERFISEKDKYIETLNKKEESLKEGVNDLANIDNKNKQLADVKKEAQETKKLCKFMIDKIDHMKDLKEKNKNEIKEYRNLADEEYQERVQSPELQKTESEEIKRLEDKKTTLIKTIQDLIKVRNEKYGAMYKHINSMKVISIEVIHEACEKFLAQKPFIDKINKISSKIEELSSNLNDIENKRNANKVEKENNMKKLKLQKTAILEKCNAILSATSESTKMTLEQFNAKNRQEELEIANAEKKEIIKELKLKQSILESSHKDSETTVKQWKILYEIISDDSSLHQHLKKTHRLLTGMSRMNDNLGWITGTMTKTAKENNLQQDADINDIKNKVYEELKEMTKNQAKDPKNKDKIQKIVTETLKEFIEENDINTLQDLLNRFADATESADPKELERQIESIIQKSKSIIQNSYSDIIANIKDYEKIEMQNLLDNDEEKFHWVREFGKIAQLYSIITLNTDLDKEKDLLKKQSIERQLGLFYYNNLLVNNKYDPKIMETCVSMTKSQNRIDEINRELEDRDYY